MLYKIKQYILFLANSTNQHGVHSPFVYNLVTKCFYNKEKYSHYAKISDYKKRTSTKKNIKSEKLLYRLTRYFKPINILQLSSNTNNINNYTMGLAQPQAAITTIKTSKLEELETKKRFDLIFFDIHCCSLKNKNLTHTLNLLINNYTHNNSILVLSPINKIKEIKNIFTFLKKHPKTTVTINTFFLKIIFFRKEQRKENFTIRP